MTVLFLGGTIAETVPSFMFSVFLIFQWLGKLLGRVPVLAVGSKKCILKKSNGKRQNMPDP